MPPSSFARRHIDHVTSKTDAMLAAAGVTGIEIHNLSEIRQRLAAHETERASLPPSRRRASWTGSSPGTSLIFASGTGGA